MSKISDYQKQKLQELKQKAVKLYRQGLTLREVEKVIGKKRSYEWIRGAVKELDKT